MHERLLAGGNVEQRIALARHLAQSSADEKNEIGRLDARNDFRIRPDAEIAGIACMRLIEEMPAPEGIDHRQMQAFGKARHGGTRFFRPAAATEKHDRAPRAPKELLQPCHVA